MRSTYLLGLCLFGAAACGGGGGGGGSADSTAPTLVRAAIVVTGAAPAAGDTLLLTLSEDVLLSGSVLDDTDVALSNGTLGGVTAAPTLVTPRTIQVVLGAGVTLTAGTTTIAFGPDNDAVTDAAGNPAGGGGGSTISLGDGVVPTITRLTLNSTENALNGTGAAGGTLQVPANGFTIDVAHNDDVAIGLNGTVVTADIGVFVDGAERAPGTNLADALTRTGDQAQSTFAVPASVRFPVGATTLTVYVVDVSGMVSDPASFGFLVDSFDNDTRPFESGQTWFIDFSRDVESFGVTTNGSATAVTNVTVLGGANGRADLFDIFRVVGLNSSTPIANVSGGLNSNQVVVQMFEQALLNRLDELNSETGIVFTRTSPGTFPPTPTGAVNYASGSFSQICLAGSPDATGSGVLGAALFDPNNEGHEDNCLIDTDGFRLGVFAHTSIRTGYFSGPTSTFRQTYDQFTPALTGRTPAGLPIGNDADDDDRLNGVLTDARADAIQVAIDFMARHLAVVMAHECGHSMGLVANGAMPDGLYGDDAVNFPLSGGQPASNADGHIQNISLFPSGAQNIMSPGIDFDLSLSANTTFNSLNLSYLRERAIYNRQSQ